MKHSLFNTIEEILELLKTEQMGFTFFVKNEKTLLEFLPVLLKKSANLEIQKRKMSNSSMAYVRLSEEFKVGCTYFEVTVPSPLSRKTITK